MKTSLFQLGAALLALLGITQAGEPADYVAHEWGTFTSVQGADGVQLEWNPLLVSELPKFVYDRNRSRGRGAPVLGAKTGLVARQRLETPVIYFYSDQERQVDVSVTFPEGTVTEWYPQQNPVPKSIVRPGDPAARWQNLRIFAHDAKAPAPPQEDAGSHYYAARVDAANSVQIATPTSGMETEKFLFYRGVGRFTAPLTVKLSGPEAATLELTNAGVEQLPELFVYEVRGSSARLGRAPALAPGAMQAFTFDAQTPLRPLAEARAELARQMHSALVRDGLYPAEASAMIATWDDAWFAEGGLRVLYLLPRAWTDRTLPLALHPPAREVARVMVGRAEIITPQVERALHTDIENYRTGDEVARALAMADARATGLGRFAEPAVRRLVLADPKNREFGKAAWELLYAAFMPQPIAPVAAR